MIGEPDLDGKQGPLDAEGKPQALRFSSWTSVDWERDATLERKLLIEYLQRAHAFRKGSDNQKPFRTSSIRARNSGAQPRPRSARPYDAEHAFANPSGARYNQKAAEDAWAHTRQFLQEHLK